MCVFFFGTTTTTGVPCKFLEIQGRSHTEGFRGIPNTTGRGAWFDKASAEEVLWSCRVKVPFSASPLSAPPLPPIESFLPSCCLSLLFIGAKPIEVAGVVSFRTPFAMQCLEAFEGFNIYEVHLCPVCRQEYESIDPSHRGRNCC